MIVKTDFLISPAYRVPPINTIFRAKFTSTNVDEFVPSRAGSASNNAASITVNSGENASVRSAPLSMNRSRAKRFCHAYVVSTRTGKRYRASAPT